MKPKFRLLLKALLVLYLLSLTYKSFGYIERRYTLQEVIESCTNIVFGTVESVDTKRLRAIIKVDEDVLGKSRLEKIKINLAVGQRRPESSPEQMIKHFREGKPAVIFYDLHSGQLNSLGHVGGKWSQCKTYVGKEWEGKNWRDRWWNFTHKEIHMYHAYKGWTVNLQKRLREVLQDMNAILAREPAPGFKKASESHIKILVFSNRKYPTEFRTLRRISKIDKYQFACQRTYDPNLPELEGADILWIGYRALGEGGYSLNRKSEEKIKKFVENGGVVIVSGQDSDDGGRHLGWFSGKLRGVESDVQTGIHPKRKASKLFKQPNEVSTDNIYTEDTWNHWGRHFDVLATTDDDRNVAVGTYRDGKGMYLITSLHHQTFFQVSSNQRLIENLIYFAAEHLRK
ncbi:TPA: hypothetical protein EYP66_17460 [Candidatus Poribacteria bacterium]|nr:hypothetical protein [Candidatus Poribacteria bacterium]